MATDDTLFVISPLANEPPASGGATAGSINSRPTLEFPDSSVTSAVFTLQLPRQYTGSGLRVMIEWASAGPYEGSWQVAGDTGNVINDLTIVMGPNAHRFTDDYVLYWSYERTENDGIISFYRSPAKTTADLIARGAVNPLVGGHASLGAWYGSQITGVAIINANAATDNDSGNTATHGHRVCWRAEIEKVCTYPSDYGLGDDHFDSACVGHGAAMGSYYASHAALINVPAENLDGIQPGDLFRLRISRNADAATDTLPSVAKLLAVLVLEA